MTDRPPLTEMLEFARKEMRTTIRSALPEEHKYSALMIANLLAIAVRTLETDPGEREILLRTLQGLTKSEIRDKEGLEAFPDDDLEILGRKIREGAFDPGSGDHDRLFEFLKSITVARVKRFNPKALE